MTDDELNGNFEAIHTRIDGLAAQINDNHERDIERFRALDDRLRGIHGQLRTIDTLLNTIAGMLTDFAGRITKLEGH